MSQGTTQEIKLSDQIDTWKTQIVIDFEDWKKKQRCEIRGDVLMYDVERHYKWLTEDELFDYYMNIGRYL